MNPKSCLFTFRRVGVKQKICILMTQDHFGKCAHKACWLSKNFGYGLLSVLVIHLGRAVWQYLYGVYDLSVLFKVRRFELQHPGSAIDQGSIFSAHTASRRTRP